MFQESVILIRVVLDRKSDPLLKSLRAGVRGQLYLAVEEARL
jgi:hypothetical protein